MSTPPPSKTSFTVLGLVGIITLHFALSLAYSFILPWGGDEWYTYNGFTIMALPFQLLIGLSKYILGEVTVSNFIIYRQIGTFFTFILFGGLGYAYVQDKQRRGFHLFSILFLAFNAFIIFQEQMFRYYGLYLLCAFLYFYAEWIYLNSYAQKRWLFYLLFLLSPFLHFFLGWQLFFYIIFQEYHALKSRKSLRNVLIGLALIGMILLAAFWKHVMAFLLPLAFGEMTATGMELRGLSLGLALKIPLTIFQFFFGYDLAPTEHPLILFLFAAIGIMSVIGLIKLLRNSKPIFYFVFFAGLLPFVLMYLLLEPLTLPGSTQFESKHALFFLPFLLMVLYQTLQGGKRIQWLGAVLIAIALMIGVGFSFLDSPHANWRRLAAITKNAEATLVDGRAQQSYAFYAPSPQQKQISLWDTSEVRQSTSEYNRIALILNDFKSFDVFGKDQIWNTGVSSAPRNEVLIKALRYIKVNNFHLIGSYVSYPTMAYVFEKKASPGYIPQPYEMAYKDLELPIIIKEDTILGWKKISAGDTISVFKPFYYFIQKRAENGNSSIKRWQKGKKQAEELALLDETNGYRKIYTRALKGYQARAYKWRKRPLLSSSFAYPGSFWPGEGFIYQFTPGDRDSILFIDDKNTVLFLGIQE